MATACAHQRNRGYLAAIWETGSRRSLYGPRASWGCAFGPIWRPQPEHLGARSLTPITQHELVGSSKLLSSGSVHEELDAVVEAIDRQAADLRHPLMSTDQLLHGLGTPV